MGLCKELRETAGDAGNGLDRESRNALSEAADEIERLRTALLSLTEDPPATLDEPDPDWEVIIKIRNIAREALGLPYG